MPSSSNLASATKNKSNYFKLLPEELLVAIHNNDVSSYENFTDAMEAI